MAFYTPAAHWYWHANAGIVQLNTATSQHLTAFKVQWDEQGQPFTLEHAELFWLYWEHFEPLNWPEAARFAATIDALAGQLFMAAPAQKSFYCQLLSEQYKPAVAELVWVSGQSSALAIVIRAQGHTATLLLLETFHTVADKVFEQGALMTVLHNRLLPFAPTLQKQRQTAVKIA